MMFHYALDNFMRVMGFSVDFQRQLQEGDEFELVYKKTTDRITGETLSVGDVHYATWYYPVNHRIF